MKNLVVIDHPYTLSSSDNVPHHRSFTAAIAKNVIDKLKDKGEEVDIIDLHADNFDPVMHEEDLTNWRRGKPMNDQVSDYQKRMLDADRMYLIFPIWWEQMPAMMKGFADKVYSKTLMYDQEGLLYKTHLKKDFELVVMTVNGTPTPLYDILFDNVLDKGVDRLITIRSGIKHFRYIPFTDVDKMTLEERQKLLAEIKV